MTSTFHLGRKAMAGEEEVWGEGVIGEKEVQKKWKRSNFPCEFLTGPHFCIEFFNAGFLVWEAWNSHRKAKINIRIPLNLQKQNSRKIWRAFNEQFSNSEGS